MIGFCLFITTSLVTQKQFKNKLSNHKRTVCTEKAAMLLTFQSSNTESVTALMGISGEAWSIFLNVKCYILKILLQCQVILPSTCFSPPPSRDQDRYHCNQITPSIRKRSLKPTFFQKHCKHRVVPANMDRSRTAMLAHFTSWTLVYANSQTHELPQLQQAYNLCLPSFAGSVSSGCRLS